MHLEYTPEQQQLRTELRAYFAELVPDRAYSRFSDHVAQKRFYRETIRRLGADGWLGVGWPQEYGGAGCPRWNSSSSSTRPRRRAYHCR